jgi:3-oxoacyl-[acyl-carrier-protein] synthase-3
MPFTISAVSFHLPETSYSNEDFFREFPEMKGKSLEKTGVVHRKVVQPGDVPSDLALKAAEKLMEEHKIDRDEIDLLVYCSLDFDYYTPTTSTVIHGKLGLKNSCGAFDFSLGCSAYVYALATINGLMATTGVRNALLLTASGLTRFMNKKDKSNRFLFGDAGTATFITNSGKGKIGPFVFGTDGKGFEKIIVRDGYMRNPISETSYIETTDEYGNVNSPANFYMDGLATFLFGVRRVPPMISELLQKANLSVSDIDLFIFHQPNVFLNETLRKKIGIPEEKFVHCMENFGNTVQATIPIAIHESIKNGRLKPGMKVVLAGFGVGLSWAATIVEF